MNTSKPINILINDFLSEKDCMENTLETYKRKLRLWVDWMVVNADISNPTTADLVQYKKQLLESDHRVQTVDGYVVVIKMFFKWLKEKGIYDNISKPLKWQSRSMDYEKGYLSKGQVSDMLTKMPKETAIDKRNYAIVNLMVRTGIRCIEVVRLDRSDVTYRDPDYFIKIQRKGRISKDATIRITKSIYNPINEYLSLSLFSPLTDPVFRSMGTRPDRKLTTKTIGRIVTDAFILIGIKDKRYTAHSLRHTAAINSLKGGALMIDIQQMLGHKSITTTERYIRELQRDNIEATAAIMALENVYEIN